MPSLTLRLVGMSYVVEGLREAGLNGRRMYQDLVEVAGDGVAPLLLSKTAAGGTPIDAVIVDRKAMPRSDLRVWLPRWIARNHGGTAFWDDSATGGTETLRFPEKT